MAIKHNDELAISFVIAANDELVLHSNALASPALRDDHQHEVLIQRGFPSASLAYNDAIDKARHDVIVCMHQDIYLPENWVENLQGVVNSLETSGRRWGVLGCYGISLPGAPAGHIFSNGLNRELGSLHSPVPAQSLDEAVLILRKSRGLRFDPQLPYFHLYGADICLQARRSRLENYAISNFCVHNSIAIKRLPTEFWRCAEYLRVKWRNNLPIKTCCVILSPWRITMWMRRARAELNSFRQRRSRHGSNRLTDPGALLANLQPFFCKP